MNDPAPHHPLPASPSPSEPIPGSEKPTVLCVDDEPNILSALQRLLRSEGYRILKANSGPQGLEILEREAVDVIVSDMRMPNMSGAQFLAAAARQRPQTVRILLTGYADLESTVQAINEGHIYRYLSKPWEDADLKIAVARGLEYKRLTAQRDQLLAQTRKQNAELRDLNVNLENRVEQRTEELRQTALFLESAYDELRRAYRASIPVFARLVEMREGTDTGHGRRIADLAVSTARILGIEGRLLEAIEDAALLHDIGKIGMEDKLLRTPYSELSPAQRKEEQQHGLIGQALLMSLQPLEDAARIIRSHHERYDGSGYPDGLKGEEIPLGARILSAASDFDAGQAGTLVTDAMTWDEARAFIAEHAGSRYDPTIAAAFLDAVEEYQARTGIVRELKLTSDDLRTGLTLSRDLEARQGMLLLAAGHVLNETLISRIRRYEADINRGFTVYVYAPQEEDHATHSAD